MSRPDTEEVRSVVDETHGPVEHHGANPLHASSPAIPPTPDETVGFMAVLKVRDFFYLWIAQVLSQLADKFIMFSLVLVVYTLTKQATSQSFLMMAFTFPSVLFSAAAGVYVDRHDKKMLMFVTNILRGGLILVILLLLLTSASIAIVPLLVVTFIYSSIGQVYAPAEAASIPSLVSKDQINAATSLFMTTVILTIVLGIPLATLSLRLFGQEAPFLIAAALYIIAGAAVLGVGQHLKAVPKGMVPEQNVMREFREGLSLLRKHPVLRLALGELSLALTIVFTVFVLGPDYMARILHRSPDDTYLVLIPATIGMIGMAVVLARRPVLPLRGSTIAVLSMFLSGIVLIFLGGGPLVLSHFGYRKDLIFFVMIVGVVFGAALGALLIPAFAALQHKTTAEVRGRIFGGVFTVINAAIALPLLLAGTLADHIGVGVVIGGMGGILVLGAIAGSTFLKRALQRLDPSDDEEPITLEG